MKPKIVLEYFADEHLKNPIPTNESGQPVFDWGETIPGERKEKIFYIKNNTHDTITLRQPHSTDEDFKIIDYPTQLKGKEVSTIKLEFAPAWNRIIPLNAGFDFDKIIG